MQSKKFMVETAFNVGTTTMFVLIILNPINFFLLKRLSACIFHYVEDMSISDDITTLDDIWMLHCLGN